MGKENAASARSVADMTTYSPSERELLGAVRDLVAADRRMRLSLSTRMQMNLHDLQALRHVITSYRRGGHTTPRGLAEELGISTASTTVLVDRLVAQGHLERAPHPTDGRSKTLLPTETALGTVHVELTGAHDRMREAAAQVPAHSRAAVRDFLQTLTEVMLEETKRPHEPSH
jgi:DNA-binding MarR family transcriptional regulator